MRFFSKMKLPLVTLALTCCLLLPALPAEASGYRLVPSSQDWQGVWEQLLSWFGYGEERGIPASPDQPWSSATGQGDAGPAIDPDGSPRANGPVG